MSSKFGINSEKTVDKDIFFEVNSVAAVLCQSLTSKLFRIFVLFRQSLRTLLGGPFNDTYSVSLNLEESSDNYN